MKLVFSEKISDLVSIFTWVIFLLATTWRILEITVLRKYFNSLKNHNDNRSISFIPLN